MDTKPRFVETANQLFSDKLGIDLTRYSETVNKQPFLRKLYVFASTRGFLSPSQELAGRNVWARMSEAEKTLSIVAPNGRCLVRGEVVSRKLYHYPSNELLTCYKVTVKDREGWFGWFSEPSKAVLNIGDYVEVRATFTQSAERKSFAFGNYPILTVHVPKEISTLAGVQNE